MSDGRTHEKYILYATGITLIGSVLLTEKIPLDLLTFANLGMVSNVFVSSDFDQDGIVEPMVRIAQVLTIWIPKTKFKDIVQDRVLKLIKILISPYSIFFSHRIFWTHLPILGTLIRWGYLYLMFWKIFLSNYYTFAELNHLVLNVYLSYTIVFLIFAAIGDTIHATLDSWELNWNFW